MQMAHHEVAAGDHFHLRLMDEAVFSGGFTARMETAYLGWVEGAWHLPFQDDVFPLRFHGGVRMGTAETSARVYGWSGEWQSSIIEVISTYREEKRRFEHPGTLW
jgi:hypothetical protein